MVMERNSLLVIGEKRWKARLLCVVSETIMRKLKYDGMGRC